MPYHEHPVSVPRAVHRHLRRGATKLVIVPASKANSVGPNGMLNVNRKLGLTIRYVRGYESIGHALANERPEEYLHGATRDQVETFWRKRVSNKEARGPVVVYEVVR